jgi:hypothetical protein
MTDVTMEKTMKTADEGIREGRYWKEYYAKKVQEAAARVDSWYRA